MTNISLLISVIVLFFCSCQKEVSHQIPTETLNNDSTTLIKYVDLDTARTVGLDTLYVGTYTYDNSKRVIQSSVTEYVSGVPDIKYQKNFYYILSDTLPFKKIETYLELPSETVSGISTGYFSFVHSNS